MNAKGMIVSTIGILMLMFLGVATQIAAEPSGASRANGKLISSLQAHRYSLDFKISASVPLTTATPIRTFTLTPTPTPSCCFNVTPGTSSVLCLPTNYYYYSFSLNNGCAVPTTGFFNFFLEVSPNPGGPWTNYRKPMPTTQTLQPGSNTVSGSEMVIPPIPQPYDWYRIRMRGSDLAGCWMLDMYGGPASVCREATPIITPTYVPSYTRIPTSTPTPPPGGSPTVTETPCPMNFSDVNPSDYFYEDVLYLYCQGAISGYSDGTFRPYNSVTRGQIIKIIVLAFDIPIYVPPDPIFCGVPSTDPFFIYITSYFHYTGQSCEGDFNPYVHMTRGQLTKVIVLIACWPIDVTGAPHFSDVTPSDVFYDYIETVYNRGIISGYGDGTFRPYNNVTRGQVSKIIHRAVLQGSNCPPYFTPTPPVPTLVPKEEGIGGNLDTRSQPLITPTPTPTIGGSCGTVVLQEYAFCSSPSIYAYVFTFLMQAACGPSLTGDATVTFEVSPSENGPWVTLDQITSTVTLQRGLNDIRDSMIEQNIPSEYRWYRITYLARFPGNIIAFDRTGPDGICAAQATVTPTRTPSGSPTATDTPCPMSFSDVNPGDYFYEAVRYLYCHGAAISGYDDGTFRPYNNVSRGQICKIVVVAFDVPIDTQGGPHFTDVSQSHPFYEWIESAYNSGIITGYDDGTFRPYNNVTRGQLTKIICRVIGLPPIDPPVPTFSDVSRDSPFYGYVEAAYCAGVINGYSDGTFRPYNNVTRGQTSVIVYRALQGVNYCGTPTPEAIRY